MMLKLTRPDGKPVWINPEAVVRVATETSTDEVTARGPVVRTHLDLANGQIQTVREAAEDVVGMWVTLAGTPGALK